jgi:hypothetical protein
MMGPIGRLGGLLAGLDPGYVALREASQTFFAVISAFTAMGLIDRFARQPQTSSVLAVIVTIMASRALRGASARQRGAALLLLPLFIGSVTTAVALAGVPWAGPAAFVVTCFVGTFVRRFGDTAARFGRLAVAPLLAALMAVPSGLGGQQDLSQAGFIAAGCGFAVLFCWLFQQAVLPERPVRVLRAALRTLLREGGAVLAASSPQRLTAGRRRRARRPLGRPLAALRRAAAVADQRLWLFADSPGAEAVRRAGLVTAVFDAEVAAEAVASSAGAAERVTELAAALEALRRAAAVGVPLLPMAPSSPPVAAPGRPRRILVASTRTAIQLSAALTLAYAVGGLLFGHLGSWVVITAFVVSQGVRSREDVVYKGLRRIAGALAGTVGGTVLASVTGDRVLLSCAAFSLLYAGVLLRRTSYASWVFCVTSILALLYRIMGFSGAHLLELRLLEIVVGTACGSLSAYLLVPVRASDLARNQAGRALGRLRAILKDTTRLLQAPGPHPHPHPHKDHAGLGQHAAFLRQAARAFDRDIAQLRTLAGPSGSWRRLPGPWQRHRPGSPSPVLGPCGHAVRSLASAIDRVPADDELSRELRRLIAAVQPNVIAARDAITRKAAAGPAAPAATERNFAEFSRRLDIRGTMPASARRGYETSSAALRTINESLRQIQP